MQKNVILLIVDALMPSRTGFGGNLPSLTPVLNNIVKGSLSCDMAFSMGNPTEFALPGLFASSYLLDAGFGNGLANCELTLAEVLQRNGYQTGAFFPIYRPFSHGYDRGFDQFFHLCDAGVILKNFANTTNWYYERYHSGNLPRDECLDLLSASCADYLDDLVLYSQMWQGYRLNPLIPESRVFDRIDFESLERAIKRERETFQADRNRYVCGFLEDEGFTFVRVVAEIVEERVKKAPTSWLDLQFRGVLLRNLYTIWNSTTSYKSAKECFASALFEGLQGHQRWNKYPSGGFMFQTFENWVRAQDRSSPFYAYIHLEDVHESNYYSYDVVGGTKGKRLELKLLKQAITDIKREPAYKGNVLYDCSIKYVDHMIARLRTFLKLEGLLEDTIIVITSDHGGCYANIPARDHITAHQVDCFFDELYHIPLVFSGSGISPSKHNGLVSSVDIPATILDMIDIAVPKSFRGIPIRGGAPIRKHVMMENQGRGPCDLARKPIRVCVRTEHHKIVYEADPILESSTGRVLQVYDLLIDPEEHDNRVDDETLASEVEPLRRIAEDRINDIRRMAQRGEESADR